MTCRWRANGRLCAFLPRGCIQLANRNLHWDDRFFNLHKWPRFAVNTHPNLACVREEDSLTVFTCGGSRNGRVVDWVVGCDLLGDQSHDCIIRNLGRKRYTSTNVYSCKWHDSERNKSYLFFQQQSENPWIKRSLSLSMFLPIHSRVMWIHTIPSSIDIDVLHWAHIFIGYLTRLECVCVRAVAEGMSHSLFSITHSSGVRWCECVCVSESALMNEWKNSV